MKYRDNWSGCWTEARIPVKILLDAAKGKRGGERGGEGEKKKNGAGKNRDGKARGELEFFFFFFEADLVERIAIFLRATDKR